MGQINFTPLASTANKSVSFTPLANASQAATPILPAAPSTNAFSDAGDVEGQNTKNTFMVTQQLHNLITQGVPANDLRRLQLVNYLKTNQGVARSGPVKSAVQGATSFMNAMPQAATQASGIPTALRFGASVGEVPQTLATGQATNKTYNIPGFQPFQSIQSQESQRIQQGMNPVKAGALAGANAVGGGIVTAGLGDMAQQGLSALGDKITTANQAALDANAASFKDSSVSDIQDTISPKLTAKETRLALTEGRLVEGQDPTLLKNGTPDSVIPSDKVVQAAQTIHEQIPGAADMSQPQLYDALNKNGIAIRDSLTPVMQQTPVTDETLQSINDNWAALKAKQAADPYISKTVDLPKLQDTFEENFLQKSGNQNMNDLWQTTQAYDASVPTRVKMANSMSSETLQDQKAIWLQNRSILTDATHSVSTGLDQTSQQAFSDMSDMYTAKENIISKVKLDKVGGVSKIAQWIEANPWKAGAIGYAANKTAKGLGLPSVPLPF